MVSHIPVRSGHEHHIIQNFDFLKIPKSYMFVKFLYLTQKKMNARICIFPINLFYGEEYAKSKLFD